MSKDEVGGWGLETPKKRGFCSQFWGYASRARCDNFFVEDLGARLWGMTRVSRLGEIDAWEK